MEKEDMNLCFTPESSDRDSGAKFIHLKLKDLLSVFSCVI